MGLSPVWPRPWLPQLGKPPGQRPAGPGQRQAGPGQRQAGPGPGGEGAGLEQGVSYVSSHWAVRSPLVGLRGKLLSGHGSAHPRLLTVWSRVFREDGCVLESDPAAARNTHLPRLLSLLRPATEWRAGIR